MSLDLQALETSFDLVAPRGDELMDEFYSRLFAAAPGGAAALPDDMQRQKTMLLGALVLLRKSLRNLDAIVPKLRELGARHVAYGAQPEHYPVVGTVLIASMAAVAGDDVEARVRVGVGRGVRDRRSDDDRGRRAGGARRGRVGAFAIIGPVPKSPTPDDELRASRVDGSLPPTERVVLVEYDPEWPRLYAREEARIRGALGETALQVEHVGSTSIPGLAAKPIIDIVLVVPESADEPAYVPALEAAGYVHRIREPDWFEHRVLKGVDPKVNLHVFSPGCPEVERMLSFRDHLRCDERDRDLYERTKRELARRDWKYVQHYADAKSDVVEEILERARAA